MIIMDWDEKVNKKLSLDGDYSNEEGFTNETKFDSGKSRIWSKNTYVPKVYPELSLMLNNVYAADEQGNTELARFKFWYESVLRNGVLPFYFPKLENLKNTGVYQFLPNPPSYDETDGIVKVSFGFREVAFMDGQVPSSMLVNLEDQDASDELPSSGKVQRILQQVRNFLKWVKDEFVRTVDYIDQLLLGRNEWLPPVNTINQLKTTGLDPKINYLCKVVADPGKSGVYQAVAGWVGTPVWALYDTTVDFVNEQELAAGLSGKVDKINITALATPVAKKVAYNAQGQITSTDDLTALDFGRGYGTCGDAAATVAKAGTLANFVRSAGAIVGIKFDNANTASAPTLNVNSTGAAAIRDFRTNAAPASGAMGTGVHLFQFDGTYWILLNPVVAATTLNRTVGSNDNATGTVSDTGGNISVPIQVTPDSPSASSTQTTSATRSLRAQLKILIDNIAYIFANMVGWTQASSQNLDNLRTKGFYSGSFSNYPSAAGTSYGSCIVQQTTWNSTAYVNQIYIPEGSGQDLYYRTTNSFSAWGAWKSAGGSGGLTSVNRDSTLTGDGTSGSALGLANSAVTTAKITDGAVTPAKMNFPVGSLIMQLPSEPSPPSKGFAGQWEPWNDRPVLYGLMPTSASITAPAYSASETAAVAAGADRLVTHADEDQVIYSLVAAKPAGEAFGSFNPIKWRLLTTSPIYVARDKLSGHSWTSDLAINTAIVYGGTNYRVIARHNLGGKFLSGHTPNTGNRPPFESGGVHNDMIREISGNLNNNVIYQPVASSQTGTGALLQNGAPNAGASSGSGSGFGAGELTFNASRAVPTGNENSPRTLSVFYWRRVS